MTTNDHAPSLQHTDLMKRMNACIDEGHRDFSTLINMVSQLESERATLETENRSLKAQNRNLLERDTKAYLDILNLRSQVELLSQDSSHFENCHLSETLPDPELYNGDKQKLRSWTYSLRAKLAGNSDHYPSESSKIQYSIRRLTGKALDQIEPKLRKDGTVDFATTNDLITYLEITCGDPDEKDTSQRELQKLSQANRPFSDYLADFRRLADRTGFNEEAKRAALLAGLSREIQELLVVVDLPDSLEEVVAKIQKIDNRLRAFQLSYFPGPNTNHYRLKS